MATASDHHKRLVRRALEEIYANGDLALADELIHPDFVDHEPAHPDQPTGPESVRETVGQLHDTFGGLRFEVQDEIAEGDKVVQLVAISGRHTRSLTDRSRRQGVRRPAHLHLADRGRPDRRALGHPE
jgi:ketosteroid isomerase-like protein